MRSGAREVASAAAAYAVYATSVLPRVRAEQRRWLDRAGAIPDPGQRAMALASLRDKAANVEATAVFAILAPRRQRGSVIRAGAALQIAVDYLDSVDEASGGDLADRLRLHRALAAAFDLGGGSDDRRLGDAATAADDYLAELLAACAAAAAPLPHFDLCASLLRTAISRCGEGQAHTHAVAAANPQPLRAWAEALPTAPGYTWWEVAAGASSSVAAHALLAVAADPRTPVDEPALVDAAYFPPIGALTVLLDDLVDFDRDASSGQHNYLSYEADPEAAANRLGLIADRASAVVRPLHRRARHRAILAGVVGFYLSAPELAGARAQPVRRRLLEAAGPAARLLATATRLRRFR